MILWKAWNSDYWKQYLCCCLCCLKYLLGFQNNLSPWFRARELSFLVSLISILIGWRCKVKTSLKRPWYIVIKRYSWRVGVFCQSILKSPWTRTSFHAWIEILSKYKNEVIRQTKAKLISLIMIDVDVKCFKETRCEGIFEFLIMNW